MEANESAPLFTCQDPKAARRFLWRLRLRQRVQLLLIFCACALGTFIEASQEAPDDQGILLEVCLALGGGALAVCLTIALVARLLATRRHAFYDQAVIVHVGGIFTVTEIASAKKLEMLHLFPVGFKGESFHLVLVVYQHLSNFSVGPWQLGGVYPVYFGLLNSDVGRVSEWCRERKIKIVESKKTITSPWKLPLFIK
jgi:hypothetical protein